MKNHTKNLSIYYGLPKGFNALEALRSLLAHKSLKSISFTCVIEVFSNVVPVIEAMSFLTAATTRYTLRAGITAGAGTRLVLSLLLVNGFRLDSFQTLYQVVTALVFLVTTSMMCH